MFYFFTLSKTLKDRLPRHLRWLAMTNLFMLIFILTVTDFFDSLRNCPVDSCFDQCKHRSIP